jgi:hypothetical protein
VYDVDFLGPYMTQVATPPAWQSEMDRRGIQTVVFFYWWPNHQVLLRYLTHDARWALVYYDETSVVLVRRAGNDETIARATAAFAPARDAIEDVSIRPSGSGRSVMGLIVRELLACRPTADARFNARLRRSRADGRSLSRIAS